MKSPHSFIWLAVALVIVWVILRVALAITSVALHLLWIAAIGFGILWVMKQFSTKSAS